MVARKNDLSASTEATKLKESTLQVENELRDRFIFLALDLAPVRRGTYAYLEKRTGIPATRWRNVILKKQMPTLAMLSALMMYRSPYAEWLLTGNDLGQPHAPSRENWESFLENYEWVQTNNARTNNK